MSHSELVGEVPACGLAGTGPLAAQLDFHVTVHHDVVGSSPHPITGFEYQHIPAGPFQFCSRSESGQTRSDDNDVVFGVFDD